MNHLLRMRFSQIHWDKWSSYLTALLGAFIIPCRKKFANRINEVIIIRQRLVYALLGRFIFACCNNIANRINGSIISFCIKFVISRTSLNLYIVALSDVILQMIKKVLIGHLFLFVRRQRSVWGVFFCIIIADFVIITDFIIINNLILACILGKLGVICHL